VTRAEGRRKLLPYLLLGPGLIWLLVFFLVPLYYMAKISLQSGSLDTGYSLTWEFSNYTQALSDFSVQFGRSL